MRNYVEINGVTFELMNKELNFHEVVNNFSYNGREVSHCYERPSLTKLAIWDSWVQWFNEVSRSEHYDWEYNFAFGVRSYNCNFFTIHGYVKWENVWYYVDITRCHNRVYKMVF